jgi:hypothetical protein
VESFKLKQDYEYSLKLIEDCVSQILNGKYWYIKTLSTELYTLLIDRGNRKRPLILEVLPELKLHPVFGTTSENGRPSPMDEIRNILGPTGMIYPGMVSFKNGKVTPKWMFDTRQHAIPLEDWLQQPLLSYEITIYQLIKSVRNKIGAHSDVKYDSTLSQTRFFKIVNYEIDLLGLVSVAEHVLKTVK